MKDMTLKNMAQACHGRLFSADTPPEQTADGIVIDSRLIKKGFVFAAVRGERADGHQFIPQVFAEGALAVISEQPLPDLQRPYILVDSTKQALKDLAAFYLRRLDIKVIGISGSVGKTSTKEMVASVLSQKYCVHKTEGNFNNEIGLPLTIFKIQEEHQAAVLEMGISDFGEMHRLASISRPDIAIITNIGPCHLETLHTRDGVLKAKTEMFEHLQEDAAVILNGDDDKLCTILEVQGREPVFYGIGTEKPKPAAYLSKSVYASDIENLGFDGLRLTIHVGSDSFCAQIPIPGRHNIYNALAATAAGRYLGLTYDEIKSGIENARTISGRTNIIKTKTLTIIDDCYNANPVSMKASIDVLSSADGRTIAVLGDMNELGQEKHALHADTGRYLAKKGIHALFCAGTLSKELARAAQKYNPDCIVHAFASKDKLLQELPAFLQEGDTVLVKASHFMEFSEIVEKLSRL